MGIVLHWFLPTNGDSRTDLSLGNAVGIAGSRVTEGGTERAPDIGYIGQIARSAEQLGFAGALTPVSSWCEDAWIMTAALTQVTERFKFLVALRPGLLSPTLAAHMAATFQRISRGRLLLNIVTGGDDAEQRRFGDHLGKAERYRRAGEFLHILRELWTGEPVDFTGEFLDVRGARIVPARSWPDIYLGGSSAGALDVAARSRRRLPDLGRAARRGRREARRGARARPRPPGGNCASASGCTSSPGTARPARRGRRRSGCSTGSTPPRSSRPRRSSVPRGPRASGGWSRCTVAGPTRWRFRRTCGPVSAWSEAARAPRWSAATRRSPTGSRSTTASESTSSSSPATRTSKRPTRSARACMPILRPRGLLAAPDPDHEALEVTP